MKKLAIIPARGGSKRIPRKNIKEFLGRPIIAYSIAAALESGVFDEVMVSTDDKEIAQTALKYGAKVPFFRSPETSNDMAMTVPVLLEVLREYDKLGQKFEYTACIYPTAPFLNAQRLKQGAELLLESGADSVLPLVRFSFPPQRCMIILEGRAQMLHPENLNVRSQDLEPYYHDVGQFYLAKTSALIEQEKLYCDYTVPLVLPESEVQDIDNEEDWKIAEMKYRILHNV